MAYTKVVIVGGGFGGLNAAKKLAKANVNVLLIDKTNHHLFQPLLYQVASSALAPSDIAYPIRAILRNQPNATVIMADVVKVDKAGKTITALNGETCPFDYLILAVGAKHSYFGHDEWEDFAPGLKTLSDAVRIRNRILLGFERAERCDSRAEAAKNLRFLIIGGGPTGVELAGAIAEIAKHSLFNNFRKIRPEQAEIYLIEGLDQILPSYPDKLGKAAKKDLEKMGVKVLTHSKVTNITKEGVEIEGMFIPTYNVVWAAGNQASPLLKTLDVPLDRQGRAIVGPDLTIPGYKNIFVIGDAAHVDDKNGNILPGVAPAAIQQGQYVAKIIAKDIPPEKRSPFVYRDKGSMATIGKAKAIAMIGKLQFSGYFAWLAWSFLHIFYLIGFRNRLFVMIQWIFWYLTGQRTVRIINRSIEEDEDAKQYETSE